MLTAANPGTWRIRGRTLSLERPVVVGVLNVTPDSFSDGGRFHAVAPAFARARQLVADGAHALDLGGESTRPGAAPVQADEEIARILPVLRAVKAELGVPVTVDTRKAAVARAVLAEGADAINDVSALADPEMAAVVADSGAGLVLMHMRGTPETMQTLIGYRDVAAEVADELEPRLARAVDAGVAPERIVVDPGIGFAKTAAQNLELIARLDVIAERLGRPVLLGPSRKAFIGALLGGVEASGRDAGTVGACVAGLARGARIFRVHEVRAAREALDVADAIFQAGAAWAR
ncbi:dihydropteroate synthase [Longimicrobium sp.]|uniref:dihydropteroate synthase n=1 Tax=Longimicrobium sp. TaxID=2029185 RepID=UPI002C5C1D65|nr:dihydropteroate synthase [Longimicrobium sp.]HSU17941.1 dihydropteroate synthase [Longimicrobium sp.]